MFTIEKLKAVQTKVHRRYNKFWRTRIYKRSSRDKKIVCKTEENHFPFNLEEILSDFLNCLWIFKRKFLGLGQAKLVNWKMRKKLKNLFKFSKIFRTISSKLSLRTSSHHIRNTLNCDYIYLQAFQSRINS